MLLIDTARRSSVVLAAVRERRGEAAGGAGAVDARRGEEEDGIAGAYERARAAVVRGKERPLGRRGLRPAGPKRKASWPGPEG